MASSMDFKPMLIVLGILIVLTIFLNVFISPFVSSAGVSTNSSLEGFINFIDNGFSFQLPILGNITFSPVTWFWLGIDPITDWVVDSLVVISYLPDMFAVPLVILISLSFLFVVISLISGLVPFT